MEIAKKSSGAYDELRASVFDLAENPEGFASMSPAVVMEFWRPSAIVTLLGMADGTTSLYFSSGGGILGAGNHENVRQAAQEFVEQGEALLGDAASTSVYPMPTEGNVRFYLVAAGCVKTLEATEDELRSNIHKTSTLFHKGHELISTIRRVESNHG